MATIRHSALTGIDLHEPKGIESATAGQVYVATGTNTGSWKHYNCHANAVISGNTTPVTISTVNTYTKISTAMTAVTQKNISFSTDEFVISIPGDYEAIATISFTGGVNDVWNFEVALNGAVVNTGIKYKTTTSTDNADVVVIRFLDGLAVNDRVSFMVKNETDADDPVITHANFTIKLLGAS